MKSILEKLHHASCRFRRPWPLVSRLFPLAIGFSQFTMAQLAPEFQVIAVTGNELSGGSGLTLDVIANPTIDPQGRILFSASTWDYVTGDVEALFVERNPINGLLYPILRKDQTMAGGTTIADPLYYPGQRLGHTADGTFLGLTWILDTEGFPEPALIRESPSGLAYAARVGQSAPDGNGYFTEFTSAWYYEHKPMFAQGGSMVFDAQTAGGTDPVSRGVFRSGPSGLEVLARHRQTSPDSGGKLSYPTVIAAGGNGCTLIGTEFVGGSGAFGLLLYESGGLSVLFREGDTLPGAAWIWSYGYQADVNSDGDVAFTASGYTVEDFADFVYFYDGSSFHEVLRPDATTPVGSVDDLDLNESGALVYSYQDELGNSVIAVREPDGSVRQLWNSASDGYAYDFTDVEINDDGDVFAYSYSGGWCLFFDSDGFKYPIEVPGDYAIEDPYDSYSLYPEDLTAPRMDPDGRIVLPVGYYGGEYYESMIVLWTPPATPPAVSNASPTIEITGGDVLVGVSSMTGHSYQLMTSQTLIPPFSQVLAPVSGTGEILSLEDRGGGTHERCFYNIEIQPEPWMPPAE